MFIFLLALIPIAIIGFFISNKVHFDFKSLFKKGFEKKDDLFGLYTYDGVQGSGKTLSSVKFVTNTAIENNYRVITNVYSYNPSKSDENFNGFVVEYEKDIFKIIDKVKKESEINNKYLVFFDEIFTVLQKSVKNPRAHELMEFLAQLRKRKIVFVTTAQIWSEIPLHFRRFCRFRVACNMINIPIINRAFHYNIVSDAVNIKWDEELQDFNGPLIQTNIAKCNLYYANMYDTFETIDTSFGARKRSRKVRRT